MENTPENGMPLEEDLTKERAVKLAQNHSRELEANRMLATKDVNTVRPGAQSRYKKPTPRKYNHPKQSYKCGGAYPHEGRCPAQGKFYTNCGKQNHFAKEMDEISV